MSATLEKPDEARSDAGWKTANDSDTEVEELAPISSTRPSIRLLPSDNDTHDEATPLSSHYNYPYSESYDELEKSSEAKAGSSASVLTYGGSQPRSMKSSQSSLGPKKLIRKGNVLYIISITILCAGVPILLGGLFLASLKLNAPSGIYRDGLFTRAQDEGLHLYVGTDLLNPLLIASVTSTVVSAIGPLVLGLVAFHLAHQWIRASGIEGTSSNTSKLPTPYQHSLLLQMGLTASELSLFQVLRYWLQRSPTAGDSQTSRGLRRKSRARLSPMLVQTAIVLFVVLLISYAIKVVDIVLHKQIISTVIITPQPIDLSTAHPGAHYGGFELMPTCAANSSSPACPVSDRASMGFQAAANLSRMFSAYDVGYVEDIPNVALLAQTADRDTRYNFNASTLAVGTNCSVYRPICYVNGTDIEGCWAMDAPPENFFVATVQNEFMSKNLQVFLAPDAEAAQNGGRTGGTSTRINPHKVLGWSCFPDYANIRNNDTDYNVSFANYWMIGAGIANKPLELCSLFACDIAIYDAEYRAKNMSIEAVPGSLKLAQNSSVLTLTDVLAFPSHVRDEEWQERDSGIYKYTPRYMDAQLQTAITSAGNLHGNDTVKAYPDALAQALSNLIVSWSAGAVQPALSKEAVFNQARLAVQMPVALSLFFVACHYIYAILIIVLGISCLFIPTVYAVTDKTVIKHGVKHYVAVPQVDIARLRFTDVSSVIHELVPPNNHSSRIDPLGMFDEGPVRRSTSVSMTSLEGSSDTALLRKKGRAEKELKTVLVQNDVTGELNLKIEGR